MNVIFFAFLLIGSGLRAFELWAVGPLILGLLLFLILSVFNE